MVVSASAQSKRLSSMPVIGHLAAARGNLGRHGSRLGLAAAVARAEAIGDKLRDCYCFCETPHPARGGVFAFRAALARNQRVASRNAELCGDPVSYRERRQNLRRAITASGF